MEKIRPGFVFTPGDDSFQTTFVEQSADASPNLLGVLGSENLLYLPATRPGGHICIPLIPIRKTSWGVTGNL